MRKNAETRSTRNTNNEPRKNHKVFEHEAKEIKFPFAVPDYATIDALAIMPDEELSTCYTLLNQQRNELLRQRLPTQLWDTELAYIQRETKIRADRRIRHREFMDEIQDEIRRFHSYEATLPEFVPNASMEMN